MSDTPLALSQLYKPGVDAAGWGRSVVTNNRRGAICNYLLTAVWCPVVRYASRGESGVAHELVVQVVPPGHAFELDFLSEGYQAWVHFSPMWYPAWESFMHELEFDLHKPKRKDFQQSQPDEIWGVSWPVIVGSEEKAKVADLIGRIATAWRDGTSAGRIDANLILQQLIAELVLAARARAERAAQLPEQRMREAIRFARRRNGVDVDVAEMARLAGYSRPYFTDVFKQMRGESPGVFLKKLRMREAATLLRTQDLAVVTIGSIVGYPDASAFGRAFKEQYGLTPRQYRQQH